MPDGDELGREHVDDQLGQARQAFDDATGARDAGLSNAVVVNRLYYACFHSAQAVLYDVGCNPTSHGAVLSLFGSEVVMDGAASRSHGRFLNRLSEHRRRADYGSAPIDVDIDNLIERTREFVS